MLACETTIVAVDFETTGAVPGYPDQPWQVGIVPIRGGRPDMGGAVDRWLQVPADRPFNPMAPGSWRRVRDQLAAAPSLAALLPELRPLLLGVPLLAHHAAAERKVLRQAWPLQRPGPWIDTLVLARGAFPSLEAHDLSTVIRCAGLADEVAALAPGRAPHDALYDAAACAALFCFLLQQPAWSGLHIEDLAVSRTHRRRVR